MSCHHHYIEDEDLDFLKDVSHDDLSLLVNILTKDKDGETRNTEELIGCLGSDYSRSWKCIASELQLFGGDTIANMVRGGSGVKYREILSDVCGKFNVETNKPIDEMEKELLNSFLDEYLKGKDTKFISEITKNLNIEDKELADKFIRDRTILKSLTPIVAQRIITLVAIEIATYVVTSRSAWAAFLLFLGQRGWTSVLGPLGWVIGAVLTIPAVSGPAYRVTIPACLAITALRRKQHDELYGNYQNIFNDRG